MDGRRFGNTDKVYWKKEGIVHLWPGTHTPGYQTGNVMPSVSKLFKRKRKKKTRK